MVVAKISQPASPKSIQAELVDSAQLKAVEEQKLAEQRKLQAEQAAKEKAVAEAARRKQQAEESKRKEAAEAKRKAEAAQKLKAEQEVRRKAEAAQKLKAEQEARRKAEAARKQKAAEEAGNVDVAAPPVVSPLQHAARTLFSLKRC